MTSPARNGGAAASGDHIYKERALVVTFGARLARRLLRGLKRVKIGWSGWNQGRKQARKEGGFEVDVVITKLRTGFISFYVLSGRPFDQLLSVDRSVWWSNGLSGTGGKERVPWEF